MLHYYVDSRGICATENETEWSIGDLVQPIAESYLELFKVHVNKREFFGLRDFYR